MRKRSAVPGNVALPVAYNRRTRKSSIEIREAITKAHHEEWARVVASLTRRFGDLDLAEEAAAEPSRPPSSGGRPTACPPTPVPG